MIPRHPLLFKVTTLLILVCLVGVMFYNSKPTIIITRSFVIVTRVPKLFTGEMRNNNPATMGSSPAIITTMRPSTTTTTSATTTTVKIKRIVHGENIKFTLNQKPCANNTFLMIYIHSGPENTERRRIIRSTWATPEILKQYDARLLFVVGQPEEENTQAALENEIDVYEDIIQGNFTDTYRNLTYKAITGLKWVSHYCNQSSYVLKTDDDIIVDIHRLVRLLKVFLADLWGTTGVLGGYKWDLMDVNRNRKSKWYTSEEEYSDPFFKPYLSGSAYIMSSDVVTRFFHKSQELPFFWIDDYFVTGMLAHATNTNQKKLNERYVLENTADIRGLLSKDNETKLIFIHSPNTTASIYAWESFVGRWG